MKGQSVNNAEFQGTVLNELKHINEHLKELNGKAIENDTKISAIEDWKNGLDIKTKMAVGIATFVGGIMVFIANFVFDILKRKYF